MTSNTVTVLVGGRDHGKTTYTKELVTVSPLPKKLIVDTFENPVWSSLGSEIHPELYSQHIPVIDPSAFPHWRAGTYLSYHKDRDYMMEMVAQHVCNCFVVLEDARRFIGDRLKKSHAEIITNSKQRNVNIVIVFHSLMQVPRELLDITDYLTLFKTVSSSYDTGKYAFDGFKEVFDHVRKSKDRYINATLRIN